jgi:hypothetical protein
VRAASIDGLVVVDPRRSALLGPLASESGRLKVEMGKFLTTVRAA